MYVYTVDLELHLSVHLYKLTYTLVAPQSPVVCMEDAPLCAGTNSWQPWQSASNQPKQLQTKFLV